VRTNISEGKVAFLVGGGSGHEPLFSGFVGKNLADGASCGEMFAAPSPAITLATVKTIHRGRGVVLNEDKWQHRRSETKGLSRLEGQTGRRNPFGDAMAASLGRAFHAKHYEPDLQQPIFSEKQDWSPAVEEAESEHGNLDSSANRPRPTSCR